MKCWDLNALISASLTLPASSLPGAPKVVPFATLITAYSLDHAALVKWSLLCFLTKTNGHLPLSSS